MIFINIKAETPGIATVTVCKETLSHVGSDKLRVRFFICDEVINCGNDIAAGKFHQVIIPLVIVISPDFWTTILSKDLFATVLHAACIDEAHCISLWGGSFPPDYTGLGVLCGQFPKSVLFVVASEMLPNHVLNDIWHKCSLVAI